MRKTFKKLAAVTLTAGMLVSSFTSGVIAQEETEEAKEVKKGTVITGFKEITDANELEPGNSYFFSIEKCDVEDAVASLPEGSAILQFAGTDVEKAVEDGTFITAEMKEIMDEYYAELEAKLVSYEAYRQSELAEYGLDKIPTTEEEACEHCAIWLLEMDYVPESWEEMLEIVSWLEDEYPTAADYISYVQYQYEGFLMYLPESEEEFLAEYDCSWDEYANSLFEEAREELEGDIAYLPEDFADEGIQQEQQGYVTVVQRGEGFDECTFGTIAYLTEETETMREQLEEEWSESEYEGPGWYYGCYGGYVGYVGPFYLYSYKVNEFTEDELIITFAEGWEAPTVATTLTKDELTLSVVIDGEEIFIPFFELADADVDPTNEDTTITITVGEIEKVVEVCNIEAGEVEKDVQISEGAPTVGLEDAVEELKETVLTEAELKLVANGLDIDIYMTVVGKEVADLGEDKAVLEEAMDEGDKAVYIDLKLFKKIGDNEPTAITEVPGGKIKVSIEVPAAIKEFAVNAKVVRVHGTEATELATTYDATTNKLTFETDRFSIYAIVYNEATDDIGAGNDTPGSGNDTPGTGNDTPGTGNDTPGTGNDTPGTGNQTPNAGDKTPETGDKAPDTGDKAPETGDKAPETGDKTPETGDKTPETGDKTPTTENKAPDAGDSSMVGLYVAIVAIAVAAMVMRKRVTNM